MNMAVDVVVHEHVVIAVYGKAKERAIIATRLHPLSEVAQVLGHSEAARS